MTPFYVVYQNVSWILGMLFWIFPSTFFPRLYVCMESLTVTLSRAAVYVVHLLNLVVGHPRDPRHCKLSQIKLFFSSDAQARLAVWQQKTHSMALFMYYKCIRYHKYWLSANGMPCCESLNAKLCSELLLSAISIMQSIAELVYPCAARYLVAWSVSTWTHWCVSAGGEE